MKRSPALRDLSSEHHTGLVLVRRIRRSVAQSPDEGVALWKDVVEKFRTKLEPHLKTEEHGLLPALSAIGELALVERTSEEH